jgi:hypothetical protein
MSDPKHGRNVGPNDPAYYAPRELRERAVSAEPDSVLRQAAEWRPRLTTEDPPPQAPGRLPQRRENSEMFTKAVAQALQEQMEPALVEAPSVLREMSRRRALFSVVLSISIAVVVAAGIASVLVMAIPASQRPTNDASSISAIWQQVKSSMLPAPQQPQLKRPATLAAQEGSALVNDALPLGIHVGAPPPAAFVAINGLPAGARLTSGRRVANEWRVPASEISGVSVIPSDGFVGQVQVTAELRDGDGAALVAGSTRLSWTAPPRAAAPPPAVSAVAVPPAALPPATVPPAARVAAVPPAASPAVPPSAAVVPPVPPPIAPLAASPPPQADVVRNLDPKEILVLVKRGQELLASGDILSARLLLQRAAEARDARAALLLGTTYDPALLKQSGANGLADVAQARNWYQKARQWGEPDAQRQLEALAVSR